jgi:hypothetical protein
MLKHHIETVEAQIERYRDLINQGQNEILHMQSTIAILARDAKPGSAPSANFAKLYPRGQLFQMCLSLLSDGSARSTSELAEECMKMKGLDPEDRDVRRGMTQQLINVLTVRLQAKQVASPGKRGRARLWQKIQ